ncbi:MAG: metallophosphoesterase [Enhygromyxa sp.]
MTMQFSRGIPSQLRALIAERKVVICAGGRVSRHPHEAGGARSWAEVLTAGANAIVKHGRDSSAQMITSLLRGPRPDFHMAANLLWTSLTAHERRELLREAFGVARHRLADEILDAGRAIWELGLPLVIYLHHDHVLRWSCDSDRLEVWPLRPTPDLGDLMRGRLDDPRIWALNGTVGRVETIVPLVGDVAKRYTNHEHHEQHTAAMAEFLDLLGHSTVLFVGFDNADFFLREELRWVLELLARVDPSTSPPHYLMLDEACFDAISNDGSANLVYFSPEQPDMSIAEKIRGISATQAGPHRTAASVAAREFEPISEPAAMLLAASLRDSPASTSIHELRCNRRVPELEDAQRAGAGSPTATEITSATPSPIMPATTVRILHISDIHFRSPNGKDERTEAIRRETPRRARVLRGEAWRENIAELLADGPIDLVFLTGDIADWGQPEELGQCTQFIQSLLSLLKLQMSRLFVVPGNHDIDRGIRDDAWEGIRAQPRTYREAMSDWMAGGKPPAGVTNAWRDQILERQAAYRTWLERDLGRAELLPPASQHRRLGYRVDVGPALKLHSSVWILGLDTAWLAGDEHDAGKLLLTKDQLLLLGTAADGHPLPGLRLALGHHPLADLADGGEARSLLAYYADLYLHGHQHQPISTLSIDPDRRLLELAAGCLFEGTRKDEHPNGFQVITLGLDELGRPNHAEIRFRSWSPRGAHWHDDSSIYRNAKHGRVTLTWETQGGKMRE